MVMELLRDKRAYLGAYTVFRSVSRRSFRPEANDITGERRGSASAEYQRPTILRVCALGGCKQARSWLGGGDCNGNVSSK
jgi:hypothetical protein